MNMSKHFQLSRFLLLMKLELFKARKGIAMIFIIALDFAFFVGMLLALLIEQHTVVFEHEGSYTFILLVGGFVVTSLSYRDLGNALKRFNLLTLPVSTLERFLCMWILTTVGWVIVCTLVFTLYTFLANPLGQLIYSKVTFQSFNPFSVSVLQSIVHYLILQGIFLVGASHLRGYVFPKIIVVVALFMFTVGFLGYFSLKDIFLSDHYCTDTGECELVDAAASHYLWAILQFAYWWILAPLCWILTYFGLKGQEV